MVEPSKIPRSRRRAKHRERIHELLTTDTAVEKLGARGITTDEAQQFVDNRYKILRNRGRDRTDRELHARRLLIGATDGGRVLTLVVEQTLDPTSWLIVTGWVATASERRMIGS